MLKPSGSKGKIANQTALLTPGVHPDDAIILAMVMNFEGKATVKLL